MVQHHHDEGREDRRFRQQDLRQFQQLRPPRLHGQRRPPPFGVNNGSTFSVQSVGTFNDGAFHHVVGTSAQWPGAVRGRQEGRDERRHDRGSVLLRLLARRGRQPRQLAEQAASYFFKGTIDEVAIYPTVSHLAQVRQHFADSGRPLTSGPSDSWGAAVWNSRPDAFWRLDESSGTVAADSSGNSNNAGYSSGIALSQASPVSGGTGTAVTLNGSSATIGSAASVTSPSSYTMSAWFSTTTTRGGKILGLGSATSGNSTTFDRNVYMGNAGRLNFSVNPGTLTTIQSAASYNDGNWHHVVATQSRTDGMRLFVDGVQVGSNPMATAKAMTGFWRIGGDNVNGLTDKPSSNYLAGSVDEVAVWGRRL